MTFPNAGPDGDRLPGTRCGETIRAPEMDYLYIAARIGTLLLMVAYFIGGVRRIRSGGTGASVLYFLVAFAFLLLSGLLVAVG